MVRSASRSQYQVCFPWQVTLQCIFLDLVLARSLLRIYQLCFVPEKADT